MSVYPDMNSVSARLHQRAQHVMPGGNTRHTVFISPYPVYAVSGAGCRVTDADGNTYIDFMNNASATIHGHAHPEIVAALRDQIGKLASVCLPTELEVRLAEMICERLAGVEQLRFCNSGSEAVMFALKAARAYTGRPKVAKVEGAYHGAYDAAEASMDPTVDNWGSAKQPEAVGHTAGTPPGTLSDVVVLPFNDVEATRALLNAHAHELAAVLIDPLVSRMSFTPATPEYLQMVRECCDASGSVLIFDEVFSFRMGYYGAQGEVGVTPDLTALGKVIGGGLPIGAIGGRREFMGVFDHRNGHPKAPHGGTFNGNPLTMVAGIKALELLTREAHHELRRLGNKARKGLNEAFKIADVEGQARGHSSMISVLLSSAQFHDYRGFAAAAATSKGFQTIHRHLINHGILTLASGGTFLSTPMGDGEIDCLTQNFLDGLRALKAKRAA